MKKRIMCLLLSVCLLTVAMVPVSACAETTNPNARLTYIIYATTQLDEIDGRADCTVSYCANDNVTKFNIKMYLEKKGFLGLSWNEVNSMSHTFYVTSDITERIWDFDGSGTYRVRAVYTAYCGDATESVTGYSAELKYTA